MNKLIKNSPLKRAGVEAPIVDCPEFDEICRPAFVLEKHLSVIRKGPTAPPRLEMYKFEEEVMTVSDPAGDGYGSAGSGDYGTIEGVFTGADMWQSKNFRDWDGGGEAVTPAGAIAWANSKKDKYGTGNDGADISTFFHPNKEQKKSGDKVVIPIDISVNSEDWEINDHVIVEHIFQNQWGDSKKAVCRLSIDRVFHDSSSPDFPMLLATDYANVGTTTIYGLGTEPGVNSSWGWVGDQQAQYITGTIISITGNFPIDGIHGNDVYEVRLVQNPAIFKHKFPKFAYRYKYEDGEYSVFSPWSEVAFLPETYDYLPKKGYNLGMENALRSLRIKDFVPKDIPKDVIQVDLLYKESNSPSVYTVASFKEDDPPGASALLNYWQTPGTGGNKGNYKISSELIHKVVPSNQMLRPWDNVPRYALAQEITANRLIFANYIQNYNLLSSNNEEVIPEFSTSIKSSDRSWNSANPKPGEPAKSLKSMRTYQLGIVYRDKYGRETPVLTAKSGSIKLDKSFAKFINRIRVQMESPAPHWAESYTFYIKETSNEYYNLAMDRWYDAEDGGVWLSFPSVERNKISDRTTLILKKQHDSNVFTADTTKYKVLSIKDNAPTFIKTDLKYWGNLPMTLPPPGWGDLGTWDCGMFYPTGLPLPARMYLDVYAEYWDQSVFKKLSSKDGAQIRIVQSEGQASAYQAGVQDNTNKTRWYDIANVEYIGAPAQTYTETVTDADGNEVSTEVEVAGQLEQLVRVSLEKALGDDAGFCKPDAYTGLSTGGTPFTQAADNELDRGLSLEVRTKEVKDKAQFEGRFFVKVLRDYNIQQNIINPQQDFSQKYQVLQTKNISYLCVGHPGVQDWNNDSKYYIPPAIAGAGEVANHPSGSPWISVSSQPTGNLFRWRSGPLQISSLSEHHANKSATYDSGNFAGGHGIIGSPIDNPQQFKDDIGRPGAASWPIGPGDVTDGAYRDKDEGRSYWRNTYIDWLNGSGDKYFKDTPLKCNDTTDPDEDYRGRTHDWPSQMPDMWNPYMLFDAALPNYATLIGALVVNDTPYQNTSGNSGYSFNGFGSNHILDITACDPFNQNQSNPYDPGTTWADNSYLAGANPFAVPAIWGDQSDFIQTLNTTLAHSGGGANNFQPTWTTSTIDKLKSDWYNLWRGRDDILPEWPLGRFHPNRWFIDKAGAAKGYSGNGIWDDGNVSYMDLSYWGIGSEREYNRKNSHLELMKMHQGSEVGFADAMSTIGTQFRFQQDPDQIIYTIVDVGAQTDIYNYEAPQGIWGIEDPANAGVSIGGAEMGYQRTPPWGGKKETSPLGGGIAFISDLFSKDKKETGGAPYNKRIRFTLTLDKLIGQEGPSSFHPITNHVDKDGVWNGKNGRHKYNQSIGGGVFSVHTGATPTSAAPAGDMDLYNINSYWNTDAGNGSGATAGSGALSGATLDYITGGGFVGQVETSNVPSGSDVRLTDQPRSLDNTFYTEHYPDAYLGLHERGLNETTIEIITPYKGEDESEMSTNPAVWETEPLEDVGLDIYYAASPSYPITIDRYRYDNDFAAEPDKSDPFNANWYDYGYRGEEVIPVGAQLYPVGLGGAINSSEVCAVQNDVIWLRSHGWSAGGSAFIEDGNTTLGYNDTNCGGCGAGDDYILPLGTDVRFSFRGEGTYYGAGKDLEELNTTIVEALGNPTGAAGVTVYRVDSSTHNKRRQLKYFNCYSYSTGVESNRIKDDFNAVTIDKGVKASMPLAEQYEEERKGSGLIFSGIYNSTSGVNRTNQFIQAEPITKDLNPVNGSIQKLFTRDTDLVTFCENKVFRIFANKDALFNADGNTNVTSTNKVLGQAKPFTGEYGISRNPESFASESYRVYFADKARGAILRLSRDGITNISDKGMKNWFKDNLRFATSIIGSYDDRENQYNITVETEDIDKRDKAYTLSFTEARKGWVSFKSFITQGGISHKNIYYTFPSNEYGKKAALDPWGVSYQLKDPSGIAETWQHNLDIRVSRLILPPYPTVNSNSFSVQDNSRGSILVGMNVTGNGVPIDTVVTSVQCGGGKCDVVVSKNCSIMQSSLGVTGHIVFTTPRNNFYSIDDNYSMIKVLFNQGQGTVKRFKTLDYEGSQAKTIFRPDNENIIEGQNVGQVYYDNIEKSGWYAYHLNTDMQVGKVREFMDKENKWYNFIRGYGTWKHNDSYDLQPAGDGIISGSNFGRAATQDDQLDTGAFSLQGLGFAETYWLATPEFDCISGTCTEVISGDYSTEDECLQSGCEDVSGCTDSTAGNYNPLANQDDGSCLYAGCMDILADNYDANADMDDGSCTYPATLIADCNGACYDPGDGTGYDTEPECKLNLPPNGCTDPTACNYDPNAECDDGSCCFRCGCMDNGYLVFANGDPYDSPNWGQAATNYDDANCFDDGTYCTY